MEIESKSRQRHLLSSWAYSRLEPVPPHCQNRDVSPLHERPPPLYHLPLLRSNEFAASAVYCKLSRGPPAARNPPPPPAIPGMHVRGLAAVKRGAVIAVLSAIGPSDISNRAPGS